MGLKYIFPAVFEYFSARKNRSLKLDEISNLQQNLFKKSLKQIHNYAFYKGKNFQKLEDFPIIDIAAFRENFEKFNSYAIDFESAKKSAEASETGANFKLANDLAAGFSTGTSGNNRGLFLTNSFERASYFGQILGKLLSPLEILKTKKIGLCLRATNELYKTGKKSKIRFFPLSTDREEIAKNIFEYAPNILIAPTQILLCLAKENLKWPNLTHLYYGAEGMNSYECQYISQKLGIKPSALYQATEGFLGAPCESGNLHLNEDNIIFEFEDLGNNHFAPIITDLKRKTQIIRRLKLDDILTFGECDCASNYKMVKNICRKNDIWHLKNSYFPDEIETLIAPFINPSNDWVLIGSKNKIMAYVENDEDFKIIEKCLAGFDIKIIKQPYSRDLDFPKRRHIRWQE